MLCILRPELNQRGRLNDGRYVLLTVIDRQTLSKLQNSFQIVAVCRPRRVERCESDVIPASSTLMLHDR